MWFFHAATSRSRYFSQLFSIAKESETQSQSVGEVTFTPRESDTKILTALSRATKGGQVLCYSLFHLQLIYSHCFALSICSTHAKAKQFLWVASPWRMSYRWDLISPPSRQAVKYLTDHNLKVLLQEMNEKKQCSYFQS